MKASALDRAVQIHHRLRELQRARRRWEEQDSIRSLLLPFVGRDDLSLAEWDTGSLPAQVSAFRRSCLDAIATEEAALQAEFDAL